MFRKTAVLVNLCPGKSCLAEFGWNHVIYVDESEFHKLNGLVRLHVVVNNYRIHFGSNSRLFVREIPHSTFNWLEQVRFDPLCQHIVRGTIASMKFCAHDLWVSHSRLRDQVLQNKKASILGRSNIHLQCVFQYKQFSHSKQVSWDLHFGFFEGRPDMLQKSQNCCALFWLNIFVLRKGTDQVLFLTFLFRRFATNGKNIVGFYPAGCFDWIHFCCGWLVKSGAKFVGKTWQEIKSGRTELRSAENCE